MSTLKDFLSKDRFAAAAGIEMLELRAGYARAQMKVHKGLLNAGGIVQGGAVFTLADFAFAGASNSHGSLALAVDGQISFFSATRSGTLFAEAVEESMSRSLSHCQVRVTNEQGEPVARFIGTAFRKKDPVPLP